jgi:LuxR family maltose regulon positive regulatory protein
VRLQKEAPYQVSALHARASEWYAGEGLLADAVRHSLWGEDCRRAADLIELAGAMVEQTAQSAMWRGWVGALPEEHIRSRPVLSVRYAYALLGSGELEAAEVWLAGAERWLDSPDDRPGMVVVDEEEFRLLPASVGVARAYAAQARGDLPSAVLQAERVLEFAPEGEHLRRGQATALLGLAYYAGGDLSAADRVFADYSRSLRSAGNLPDAISAASVLPDIRIVVGRLREAEAALQELLAFATDQGQPLLPDAADLYRGLGELALERGELDLAADNLQRSHDLAEPAELPSSRYRTCVARARLAWTRGDTERALGLLEEAELLFIRTPLPDVRPIGALRARIWAAEGRVTEALQWARDQELYVDDGLSFLREFEHVTLARVVLARFESERAEDALSDSLGLLARLLSLAQEGGRTGSAIEVLALQALAHGMRGDTALALERLEHALSLAEPEGYVRIFVDEGRPMARLLQEAASRGIAVGSTRRLLAAFGSAGRGDICPSEAMETESGPLSSREVEVLRLIAAGLTNQEIASRLYLSLYTVKAHARAIYDKLDAHNRTRAVAKARELGILPPL